MPRSELLGTASPTVAVVPHLRSGTFRREFKLGTRIDAESVEAHYNDGLLRVKLSALVAAHRPARVAVQTTGAPVVEGSTTGDFDAGDKASATL